VEHLLVECPAYAHQRQQLEAQMRMHCPERWQAYAGLPTQKHQAEALLQPEFWTQSPAPSPPPVPKPSPQPSPQPTAPSWFSAIQLFSYSASSKRSSKHSRDLAADAARPAPHEPVKGA